MLNGRPANRAWVAPLLQNLCAGPAATAVPSVAVNKRSIFGVLHADNTLGIDICVFRWCNSVSFFCHERWAGLSTWRGSQTISCNPRVLLRSAIKAEPGCKNRKEELEWGDKNRKDSRAFPNKWNLCYDFGFQYQPYLCVITVTLTSLRNIRSSIIPVGGKDNSRNILPAGAKLIRF